MTIEEYDQLLNKLRDAWRKANISDRPLIEIRAKMLIRAKELKLRKEVKKR